VVSVNVPVDRFSVVASVLTQKPAQLTVELATLLVAEPVPTASVPVLVAEQTAPVPAWTPAQTTATAVPVGLLVPAVNPVLLESAATLEKTTAPTPVSISRLTVVTVVAVEPLVPAVNPVAVVLVAARRVSPIALVLVETFKMTTTTVALVEMPVPPANPVRVVSVFKPPVLRDRTCVQEVV
jgi:hypothetical protein